MKRRQKSNENNTCAERRFLGKGEAESSILSRSTIKINDLAEQAGALGKRPFVQGPVHRAETPREQPRKKRPHPLVLLFLTLQALAWLFFAFVVAGMAIAIVSALF